MIKFFFVLFVRSARKNLRIVVANILGFAASLTLFTFVVIYAGREYNYNTSFNNYKNIYRVSTSVTTDGRKEELSLANAFVGPTLKEIFPEIETIARLKKIEDNAEITLDDKPVGSLDLFEADSTLLDVLTLEIKAGRNNAQLRDTRSVLVSTDFVLRYNLKDVLNKEIKIGQEIYSIQGVFENKENTDFHFDIIKPFAEASDFDWVTTFVVTSNAVNIDDLEKKMQIPLLDKLSGEFDSDAMAMQFSIDPLKDLHFSSKLYESFRPRNKQIVIAILLLSVVLIISSCFNYGNLTFVLSFYRSKELSIKKIMGARNGSLIWQSVIELMLLLVASCLVAAAAVYLTQEYFAELFHMKLSLADFINPFAISLAALGLLGIVVLSTASFYFFVLRAQKLTSTTGNNKLTINRTQKSMLIVQITVSISAVLVTFLIQRQINFVTRYNPGFSIDNIIAVQLTNKSSAFSPALKNELTSKGFSASFCDAKAIPGHEAELELLKVSNANGEQKFLGRKLMVDGDYFRVLQMGLINPVVMNDSVRDVMIINNHIKSTYGVEPDGFNRINRWRVHGVVGDSYMKSLYNAIEPSVFIVDSMAYNALLVNVKRVPEKHVIDQIYSILEKFEDRANFEVSVVKDSYIRAYEQDQGLGSVLIVVSVSIFLISIVGVLSLSSLSVVKRIKEFAVRRVLGASEHDILILLMKDFFILFAIAIATSFAIILWVVDDWLAQFSVRISVDHFYVLFLEIILCLFVGGFTVLIAKRSLARTSAATLGGLQS